MRADSPSASAHTTGDDACIHALGEWLAAQGLDVHSDHAHVDEGSRDRLYLRYGYFMGLQNALALLTNRGETLH